MRPDDGGNAFPVLERHESYKHRELNEEPEVFFASEPGMSMRDWFAGMALQGSLAATAEAIQLKHLAALAQGAYLIADAMLAERKKSDET